MRIIEIFRPGKFRAMNGKEIEFSAAMLDDIAKSYNPSAYKAPLVIGHPKVEDPAYGWVRGLNFANGKLQAEPESVVEEFAGIVSAGMYKNVSASFFTPDHPANPQPGKYYLKHVGFLGAVPPAVTGLKPVSFASDDSNELCFEFAANDAPPALPIEVDSKIKSTIDFAAMERALEEREQRLKQKVKELEKAEFAAFIGDLKKNGQILPSAESGLVGGSEVEAACADYFLDDVIPQSDIDDAPEGVNLVNNASEGIIDLILLDREVRAAGLTFDADQYATGCKASQKLFIKVCRAFSKLPNEIRAVEVEDYFAMIESISEVPHISDAFYYAFCGGGKSGKGGKKSKRFDLTSPEARAELFAATDASV